MLQSMKRAVYQVPDIEKAKQWYSGILDAKPVIDAPFAVIFAIGGSELILIPKPDPAAKNGDDIVVFWTVLDVDAAYKRLIQSGAAAHSEISSVAGTRRAAVKDPFGNIMGIMGAAEDNTRRSVEHQASETALGVAYLRALATIDARDEVRRQDYLAEIFLTEDRKRALKDPAIRQWISQNMMSPGVYEYIIARTAFFDHVVEEGFRGKIPQVIFLGAGYDTRSYRFKDCIQGSRIFELDIHPTQQRKRELLHQHNVSIPEEVAFVPINFNTENLGDVLLKAGFEKHLKTLVIWEGVTYYLPAVAVDQTLNIIKSMMPKGSSVCFDYSARWPAMEDAYGVKELMECNKRNTPGEPYLFAIEEGKVESFLFGRGYKIIDHFTAVDMERKYLTLRDGSSAEPVPALFRFVHAEVSG